MAPHDDHTNKDRKRPAHTTIDPRTVIDDIAAEEANSLDLPHVAHVVDPYQPTACVFGPFPSPLAAACFAEQYAADLTYDGCREPLSITIYPLREGT